MSKFVRLNEYGIIDDKVPIGYTYDILTCIGLLVHRENSSILSHIEAGKDNYDIHLDVVSNILNLNDDKIVNAELFLGKLTNNFNLELVETMLKEHNIPYEIKDSFINPYGSGSIGYNHITKEYYYTDLDYNLKSIDTLKR